MGTLDKTTSSISSLSKSNLVPSVRNDRPRSLSVSSGITGSLCSSNSNIATSPVATWHDYVHVLMMESGNVARAAIHKSKDGACLAATDDLDLSYEQVQLLLAGFDDATRLRKDGIWLDEDHFTLTRITERRIMVGRDARTGAGCVVYRCSTCAIVACYDDGNHPGACYSLVTRLGDFLVESGF